MMEAYTFEDFVIPVFVSYLLATVTLLGLVLGCTIRAYKIAAQGQWPQVLREISYIVAITLIAWVLWFDLFHVGQFPRTPRLLLTGMALLFGIVAYLKIALDLIFRYKGIRTIQHDMNNILNANGLLKEELNKAETRILDLRKDNAVLRRELSNRKF